jgi:Tfp pilus assembly protein PilN
VAAWRLIAAGLVCVASLATAVLAPVLSSRHQARIAQRTLRILGDSATVAQRTELDLSAVSNQLEALQAFAAQRRSMTLLLADLTRTLPSDVSLTSLRVDGDGGTLTALAPRGGAVISDLQAARMITSPTVVGSVTAEGSGSDRLERVSVRFRWIGVSPPKRRVAARGDL